MLSATYCVGKAVVKYRVDPPTSDVIKDNKKA